jgi:2-methylaconitate cis-trans-isomerase PrpF
MLLKGGVAKGARLLRARLPQAHQERDMLV